MLVADIPCLPLPVKELKLFLYSFTETEKKKKNIYIKKNSENSFNSFTKGKTGSSGKSKGRKNRRPDNLRQNWRNYSKGHRLSQRLEDGSKGDKADAPQMRGTINIAAGHYTEKGKVYERTDSYERIRHDGG